MKARRISILFILFTFISFSCSDSFLEKNALGVLESGSFDSEETLELLVTAAYAYLDGVHQNNNVWRGSGTNWVWGDVLSDDFYKGSTATDQQELADLERYSWISSNSYFLIRWEALYQGISASNDALRFISDATSISDEFRNTRTAEMRFLRAHYYFELQRMWGGAQYYTEDLLADFGSLSENLKNIPFAPAWDNIEADFQAAIDALPQTQTEPGRATQWAAKAYKGKVHLYQQEYNEALTLLNDVINNGPFSLFPNFEDNFRLATKNGQESIFQIQFAVNDGTPNSRGNGNFGGVLNYQFGNLAPVGCCGFYQPTQNLVNAFQTDPTTGLPLLNTFDDTDVTNDDGLPPTDPFTPHAGPLDPRLDFTVGRRGLDFVGYGEMPGQETWIRDPASGGPYLAKKHMFTQEEEGSAKANGEWGETLNAINFNVIRLADVILMAAECEAELNSLENARNLVNLIRARARDGAVLTDASDNPAANYIVDTYNTAFASQQEAIDAVRFERRLELAGEGQRFFDLRRWGIAAETLNTFITKASQRRVLLSGGVYEAKNDLCPIPINAIDLSGGALTQNPGF